MHSTVAIIIASLYLLLTTFRFHVLSDLSKSPNECDLTKDTIKVKPNSTTHFYLCQRNARAQNDTQTGGWKRYKCKRPTLEECLNRTVLLNFTFDDSFDNMENSLGFFVPAAPSVIAQPCRIEGVPYVGASCCLSRTRYLEADPTDIRLYLQCVSISEGSDWGVWIKMECPKRKYFNSITQNCEHAFGATAVLSPNSFINENTMSPLTGPTIEKQCFDGSAPSVNCLTDVDCPYRFVCTEFEDDSKMCCYGKSSNNNYRQPSAPIETCPGVPPTTANPLVSCSAPGECPVGYYCLLPNGYCCSLSLPLSRKFLSKKPALCPDASLALPIECVNSTQCPSGYYCPFGIAACCELTPAQMCPDGTAAVGVCVGGQCGVGFVCNMEQNLCCRNRICPDGSSPLSTPCLLDSQCPNDYYCPLSIEYCCTRGSQVVSPRMSTGVQPGLAPALPPPATVPPPVILCADNSQPAGACIRGLCGSGFVCMQPASICCIEATFHNNVVGRCLDGNEPSGRCINNECAQGYYCTTGNLCCPRAQTFTAIGQCQDGQEPVGVCLESMCSVGFSCTQNRVCCPDIIIPHRVSFADNLFICPSSGIITKERCSPTFQCTSSEYVCVDGQNCCPQLTVTQTVSPQKLRNRCIEPLGPCINSLCPTGYMCSNSQCCPDDRQPSVSDNAQEETKMHLMRPSQCSNGKQPQGPCQIGLCRPGYLCETLTNICCPEMGNSLQVLNRGRRPGSKCNEKYHLVCNGVNEGLAACVKGLCQCLPPARRFGATCIMPVSIQKKIKANFIRYYLDEFNDNTNSNFTVRQNDTVDCLNDTDCQKGVNDRCLNGTCISAKYVGETCESNAQCKLACKSAICTENVCQCPDYSFTYNHLCVKTCPSGYLKNETIRMCTEDSSADNNADENILTLNSFC